MDEEVQLVARQLEVAVAVHGIKRPQCIAAKIPAEARSRRISRSIETRYQGRFSVTGRGLHAKLVNGDLRPREGFVQSLVRRLDAEVLSGELFEVFLGV